MLETDGKSESSIVGIDQQDFSKIQLIQGIFPYQFGLQQRIPGKTLDRILDGPIGSIYVFYNVYGRTYTLSDFGSIQIEEVIVPPIDIPGEPPVSEEWFEDFSGYPEGLVSKFWGAGAWLAGVGVCENIYKGLLDPFLAVSSLNVPPPNPSVGPGDGTDGGGNNPPSPPNPFPPGFDPDVVLLKYVGHADFGCIGQGDFDVYDEDYLDYWSVPGSVVDQSITGAMIPDGTIVQFHGISVGSRTENVGDVVTQCHPTLPPMPSPLGYYVYPDGTYGRQS